MRAADDFITTQPNRYKFEMIIAHYGQGTEFVLLAGACVFILSLFVFLFLFFLPLSHITQPQIHRKPKTIQGAPSLSIPATRAGPTSSSPATPPSSRYGSPGILSS